VVGEWLQDLESLEAISRNDGTRRVFLHMAALHRSGRMDAFLEGVARDDELDETTKHTLAELARDEDFLLAVEEYCRQTATQH
jgi:hypothetical protein